MKHLNRPLVMAFLVFTITCASAQIYTITDLGILPTGNYSQANAINNLGQVVGTATINTSNGWKERAFLWTQRNGMENLGTLPGNDGTFSSSGSGINDFGQVVGSSWQDDRYNNVFLWTRGGGMQNLEGSPTVTFYPAAINELGHVASTVGAFAPNQAPYGSTWTRSGGWQSLDQASWAATYAYSINLSGDVVGYGWNGRSHAVLWTDGSIQDLGTLPGGVTSAAYAINARGQIVGTSGTTTGNHAFLRQRNGNMIDLGTLPGGTDSAADALNIFGAVVGWSNSQSSPLVSHAVLWTNFTGVWDLNDLISPGSGWVLNTATGINGWGQIVGGGTINGETHAFLLSPNLKTR